MTLQKKVTSAIIAVLFLSLFIIGAVSQWLVERSVEADAGNKAMHAASIISEDREIIVAMERKDVEKLNTLARRYENILQATYVVIGDTEGIRYAHPIKSRIGKPMIGDDNERALEQGESYISKKEGSLGLAIRGKSAIHNDEGEIIGVISVGFLVESFKDVIGRQRFVLWLTIAFIFILGSLVSFLLARHIKRLLLHLEPEEISRRLSERDAIMQSTREGIVAFTKEGETTFINDAAIRFFQELKVTEPNYFLSLDKKTTKDETISYDGVSVLVNQRYIESNGEIDGYVITLRKKTDLELLTLEIEQLKSYTHLLRAQTHEFKNRLHTLLGLIQLEKWDEAAKYIHTLFEKNVTEQETLTMRIQDPYIQSLLLGKLEYAKEWKVDFTIDDESILHPLPENFVGPWITIIGNVIDNAIEAASESEEAYVDCYIQDGKYEWVIEITDSGKGFPEHLNIIEKGVSEKGKQRGYGIPSMFSMIKKLNGHFSYERFNEETIVIISIPKGEE